MRTLRSTALVSQNQDSALRAASRVAHARDVASKNDKNRHRNQPKILEKRVSGAGARAPFSVDFGRSKQLDRALVTLSDSGRLGRLAERLGSTK